MAATFPAMKKNVMRPLLVFVATSALIACAWWWQRAGEIQVLVRTCRPAPPDLADAPPAMRDQILATDARTQTRFDAGAGLAQLSRIYHANGFFSEAMRCYEGLEKLEPSEPRWFHRHAAILAGYGEIEPALVLWRRVAVLAPAFLPAQLRIGDAELKSNHPAEAAASYNTVLQRDPGNAYALLGLARIDYEAQRWDQARSRLETVVSQTNYALGYDLIVTLYEKTGRPAQAVAIRAAHKASGAFRDPPDPWLDEIMDVCFDANRLALTAGFIARDGDKAKALQLLERAIALAPDSSALRFQTGLLHLAQGNTKDARDYLEQCTRLAPDFPDGWAQLSALQAKSGEKTAALRTLMAGLAQCPRSPGLHLMRAHTLRESGQNGEAIEEFRESIRLRPNEADAYIELANVFIELNQIDPALALLHQSLEAEPGNPMALGILTYHAITTGDESSALRWFGRIRQQPRVPAEQVANLRTAFQEQFGHALP